MSAYFALENSEVSYALDVVSHSESEVTLLPPRFCRHDQRLGMLKVLEKFQMRRSDYTVFNLLQFRKVDG